MKRLLSLLLILALLPALFACKKRKTDYPPVESTEEEARVLATFPKKNGGVYDVKYELYRALYLSLKSDVYANAAGKSDEELAAELDEKIFSFIGDIYAAISLAAEKGYDAFGSEADESVAGMIATSVNGGEGVAGFDGDYNAYLASLTEMNLNYSVQDLLYRYSLAYDKLLDLYTLPENKTAEQKAEEKADAEAFYRGDDSVLVYRAVLPAENYTEARANEIANTLRAKETVDAVCAYMVGFTSATIDDVKVGLLVGHHSLDEAYYGGITEAAFSLAVGGVSDPILISEDGIDRYYILYRAEKTDGYYEKNAGFVLECYLSETVGEALFAEKTRLLDGVSYLDAFKTLDRSAISMK